MARLFALTDRFEEAILIYEELGRSQILICNILVLKNKNKMSV
jgi:hypothetical protein